MSFEFNVSDSGRYSASIPLEAEEVMECLRRRWGVTYDLRLLIKRDRIYLQMMWGFLEQQSFPIDEETFKENFPARSVVEVSKLPKNVKIEIDVVASC